MLTRSARSDPRAPALASATAATASQPVRAPRVLLRLEAVSHTANATSILDGVSLDVAQGAPLLLLGPNGAGKTTLLKLMLGLFPPTRGHVHPTDALIESAPSGGARTAVAMVFQRPVMLRRTAARNLAFALRAASEPRTARDIERLLARVGLAGLGDRPARKLSVGEQQRLAIAKALALRPALLLLDEPTASLDPQATQAIEAIIAETAAAGVKIAMSSQDLGQARRLAGDVAFLAHGRLVEHGPAAAFFASPQSEAARRFLAGQLVL